MSEGLNRVVFERQTVISTESRSGVQRQAYQRVVAMLTQYGSQA